MLLVFQRALVMKILLASSLSQKRALFAGSNATVRHLDGNYPREIRVSFSAPIPLVSARVSLISTLARGEIRVVQSPTPENGYSTVVRLDDSRKGGEKRYEFTLRWELDSTK
jgi:hypothetical protein